jgi:hypothetical protein
MLPSPDYGIEKAKRFAAAAPLMAITLAEPWSISAIAILRQPTT